MLVLSRKAGERIHIGDGITIEVRRLSGNRVALAIDAPSDQRILRGELKESADDFQPTTSAARGPRLALVGATDCRAAASA